MKKFIAGLAASLIGANFAQSTFMYKNTYNPPINKKYYTLKGWSDARPSEYFGQRSKIVVAKTPKGEKLMKLKNALKGNYEWSFKS